MSSTGTPAPPRPWLKPLTDCGPLVAFFAAYWVYGLLPATAVLVATTIGATLLAIALERRIPWTSVVTAVAVGVFGALTLIFDDDIFIKIKPTIVQLLMAAVLAAGALAGQLFLKTMMAQALEMTEHGWRVLTWRFAAFFLFGAALNELVWRTQSNEVWVSFDTFGVIGLTVAFMLAQMPLLKRHGLPRA